MKERLQNVPKERHDEHRASKRRPEERVSFLRVAHQAAGARRSLAKPKTKHHASN